MRHSDDRVYYQGRFVEEMERGERAPSTIIAAVHYELAYRYSLFMAQLGPRAGQSALDEDGKAQLAA